MPELSIRDVTGKPFNAKVEIDGQDIVVHSRSGSLSVGRNPDYRPALIAVLTRLRAAGRNPDVYLDSQRVAHLPLKQRLIVSGEALPIDPEQAFATIVKAMNIGRASNGAWSRIRLRIEGPQLSAKTIAEEVPTIRPRATVKRRGRGERLSRREQQRVTDANIHAAVTQLLAGNDAPNFQDSRDYDLVTSSGDRLAPKKVFGRALELAGVVDEAHPYHFSSGWSLPSFVIPGAAGYDIVPKSDAAREAAWRKARAQRSKAEVDRDVASVGFDAEERSWIEGDKRMAGHLRTERKRSAKAAAEKRSAIRVRNDGRLACELCATDWYAKYGDSIAEAIFDVHHTIPLKLMDEGHQTKLADLLLLCANCHRAEHRKMAQG
jgi:hypothetical protein